MGRRAFQWAEERISEHKGVSVSMKAHCMIGKTDVSRPPQAKKNTGSTVKVGKLAADGKNFSFSNPWGF